MQIWVDADACPRVIKEILFRAAERAKVRLTLVANRSVHVPRSLFLHAIRVSAGFDRADQRIVELMQPGDLVVTADIPLASSVVKQGGIALDPRGKVYTEDNVAEALATRNLLEQLRGEGHVLDGPAQFGEKERQAFASGLQRLLALQPR
jgi:hypothetical protein